MAGNSNLETIGPVEVDDSDVGAGAKLGAWVAGAISLVLIFLAIFGLGGEGTDQPEPQVGEPERPAVIEQEATEPEAADEGSGVTVTEPAEGSPEPAAMEEIGEESAPDSSLGPSEEPSSSGDGEDSSTQ